MEQQMGPEETTRVHTVSVSGDVSWFNSGHFYSSFNEEEIVLNKSLYYSALILRRMESNPTVQQVHPGIC